MPLLVTPRSLNRVVALDQQKLLYSLYDQQQFHNIMSKCGSINGSQDEPHAYDNREEEEGKLIVCLQQRRSTRQTSILPLTQL